MLKAATPISIEKLGGFAGFGLPGSGLRSQGAVDPSSLSPQDAAAVDSLFSQPPATAAQPDAFRYRLTRQTQAGEQSVEVPEHLVPDSMLSAVHDELA